MPDSKSKPESPQRSNNVLSDAPEGNKNSLEPVINVTHEENEYYFYNQLNNIGSSEDPILENPWHSNLLENESICKSHQPEKSAAMPAGGDGSQDNQEESNESRKRLRWSNELHDKFEAAIAQLGGPRKATPKTLQSLMQVEGLTLFHIKSHLQKFRMGKGRSAIDDQDMNQVQNQPAERSVPSQGPISRPTASMASTASMQSLKQGRGSRTTTQITLPDVNQEISLDPLDIIHSKLKNGLEDHTGVQSKIDERSSFLHKVMVEQDKVIEIISKGLVFPPPIPPVLGQPPNACPVPSTFPQPPTIPIPDSNQVVPQFSVPATMPIPGAVPVVRPQAQFNSSMPVPVPMPMPVPVSMPYPAPFFFPSFIPTSVEARAQPEQTAGTDMSHEAGKSSVPHQHGLQPYFVTHPNLQYQQQQINMMQLPQMSGIGTSPHSQGNEFAQAPIQGQVPFQMMSPMGMSFGVQFPGHSGMQMMSFPFGQPQLQPLQGHHLAMPPYMSHQLFQGLTVTPIPSPSNTPPPGAMSDLAPGHQRQADAQTQSQGEDQPGSLPTGRVSPPLNPSPAVQTPSQEVRLREGLDMENRPESEPKEEKAAAEAEDPNFLSYLEDSWQHADGENSVFDNSMF